MVGDDQVEGPIGRMRFLERNPCGEAVPGEHGLGPGSRQHAVEDAAARLVVVGDEDAQSPEQAQVGERAIKFILPVATASGVDTITRA